MEGYIIIFLVVINIILIIDNIKKTMVLNKAMIFLERLKIDMEKGGRK